jgi:hypothetical protein
MKTFINYFIVGLISIGIYIAVLFNNDKKIDKVYIPLGYQEITCYKAVTAECGNNRGYGAFGRRVAINGHPTGKFFANNFLPRGTKIVIPSISSRQVWILEDRLRPYVNGKYIGNRIDLLVDCDSYKVARGVRKAEVYIVKEIK